MFQDDDPESIKARFDASFDETQQSVARIETTAGLDQPEFDAHVDSLFSANQWEFLMANRSNWDDEQTIKQAIDNLSPEQYELYVAGRNRLDRGSK